MAESCGMGFWITQAERFLNSDMTVKEWCACIGKHPSAMYRWMARLAEERPDVFGGPQNISDPGCSGWITRTRDMVRGSKAIQAAGPLGFVPIDQVAPLPEYPVPRTAAHAAPGRGPCAPGGPITVSVNGAEVSVPAGSDPDDVLAVLRAVASL